MRSVHRRRSGTDRDGDELPFHRHRRRADQPARRHPAGALHPSLRSPRLAPSQPSHPSPPNPISASIPSPPIRETDAEESKRRFGGNRNIKPTVGGRSASVWRKGAAKPTGFHISTGGLWRGLLRFSPDFVLLYGTGALTRGAGIAIVPRIPHDSVFSAPRTPNTTRVAYRAKHCETNSRHLRGDYRAGASSDHGPMRARQCDGAEMAGRAVHGPYHAHHDQYRYPSR